MQIGCLSWAMLLAMGRDRGCMYLPLAVIFAALTAALFLTETRAALGGLAMGCAASLLTLAGRRVRWIATVALLILMAASTLWVQHKRGLKWLDHSDTGTQYRVLLWEDGLRLVRQHPWFGVGMESIRAHFVQWNLRAFILFKAQSHFHSDPLQIAVERGLLTLAAWIWFVVAYAAFLLKLVRRAGERTRFGAGVAAGALAGLIAWLVTSIVHYNLGEEPLVMMLFFQVGLALALNRLLSLPEAIDVA